MKNLHFPRLAAIALLAVGQGGQPATAQFQDVRQTCLAFWNEAREWQKTTDPKELERRRQRGTGLFELIEPQMEKAIRRYLSENESMSQEKLRLAVAEALEPPARNGDVGEGSADAVITRDGNQIYIAYEVITCAVCSKSWIGEFSRNEGRVILQSSVTNPMENGSVRLALLGTSSPAPTLLLYGLHWGDPHNRIDLRAYRAQPDDPKAKLREVWSKLDLPQGQVTFQGDEVQLDFLSAPVNAKEQIHETYQLQGPEFIRTSSAVRPAPE